MITLNIPSVEEIARRAEIASSCGDQDPYEEAINLIDDTIGQLKKHRQNMQRMKEHVHDYRTTDDERRCLCSICGADGDA